MDNIFEILIYLFIIISFLAQFFRKKKEVPEEEKRDEAVFRQRSEREVSVDSSASKSADELDEYNSIMNEIENLFKTDSPKPIEEKAPPKLEQQRSTQIERAEKTDKSTQLERHKLESQQSKADHYKDEWHKRSESEHHVTYSEHTFEDTWAKEKEKIESRKSKIDNIYSEKAKEFEKQLSRRTTQKSSLSELKTKLNNPQTFKDYFIVSEIIRRPRFFRR